MAPLLEPLFVDSRIAMIAAVMAHVEWGYSIRAESYRNRNPGNIEFPGNPGVFRTFPTMQAGWDALYKDLMAKRADGLTLRQAIYKYAPPSENNSSMYLTVVSELTGIHPEENL